MANENVNIVLTAQDKTKQAFSGVRKGLDRVKKAVFSVKGALVSLGATAVIAKMSQDIDALGKTSAKLGIAAEQLQALRYAAGFAGVETRTLDMAMQRFTRRLSEARQGTGEAKGALEEMNISLKDASGNARSQTDVLADVADAFANITDPADKVRLAFKLFDAEGVSMVNMLEQGSGKLRQVTGDFKEFGLALDNEAIAAVEKANDRFSVLGTILSGVGDKLYVALILPLQNFTTYVIGRLLDGIGYVIQAFSKLASVLGMELESFDEASESLFAMSRALRGAGKETDKLAQSTEKAAKASSLFTENPVGEAMKISIEPIKEVTNQLDEFSKTAGYTDENLQSMAMGGIQSLEDGLVGLVNGTMSVKDAFKSMALSVINDLIRMQIQSSITGPLSGFLGGLFGGGGGGATATGAGQYMGFGFGGAKALGGNVSAGQAYTVGEQGREMFIPSTNGQIVSNDDLGGNVTVNQTINVSTGVSQTVRAEIVQMLPQITEASKAAVLQAKKQGGSFANAFGA